MQDFHQKIVEMVSCFDVYVSYINEYHPTVYVRPKHDGALALKCTQRFVSVRIDKDAATHGRNYTQQFLVLSEIMQRLLENGWKSTFETFHHDNQDVT